jgi:hypothetical protein
METRTKIKNKIAWGLFLILCFVISFMWGMNYKSFNKVEIQFDSMKYHSKLDSLNHIIQANKDTIQILTDKKAIVKIKYKKIYLNLDSTTFDEILWEHGLLDDTLVEVNEDKIVLFRLVQGAESRAINKIQDMEIKKLHSIISDMEKIRQNDSVAISFLIIDNNTLNKAYQNASNELFNVKLELNKAKQKKRLNGFKIAAIGLGGFVGGVFVGLIK